jgi:hypothetical protein
MKLTRSWVGMPAREYPPAAHSVSKWVTIQGPPDCGMVTDGPYTRRVLSIAGFMKAAAARYSRIRRIGSASRFVVFVTVLAFALQSYIAQTHIHAVHGVAGIIATHSLAHGKTPLDSSQLDCPFCQAVAHAGAFLTPTPPQMFLPQWAMSEAPSFVVPAVAAVAAAHSWQSRAPPSR